MSGADGPFRLHWKSLAKYTVPEWFRDAKFGILIHWGPYSVPAFGNEWYSRNMYRQGKQEFEYHRRTHGPQSGFGYKDFIPLLTGEHFDPDAWAALFREAGARYVVPVAQHHDGFAMYDSELNPWNTVAMGPKRDVIGELSRAVRQQSMVFGVSWHRAELWWFFNGGMTFDSDVRAGRHASLYGPAAADTAEQAVPQGIGRIELLGHTRESGPTLLKFEQRPDALHMRLPESWATGHQEEIPLARAPDHARLSHQAVILATRAADERTCCMPDPEQKARTFTNPVIPGFHPDPSICRVGEDYYIACSSFEYFPGVPIFHSRDLVHWTQIGNALDRPSQLRLPTDSPSSAGIYAPTLRHFKDRFWLIVTNVSRDGNLLVTATDPAGPWSVPTLLPDVQGIDPDIAWDEDGTCWCTTAGIWQRPLDPYTGRTLGAAQRLWSGTPDAAAPEAPHLYHIGEYWYLLIAEGGTERGHAVSIARAAAPSGPFEPCPANPILTHRGTSHPIQNTGHADLVQAPDDSWWMVLLGVRARGGTPGWHVLGRETFLAPVEWEDDWPVVGDLSPVMAAPSWPLQPGPVVPRRDDFDLRSLHPRWVSLRDRPAELCTTKERPGWLTLRARGSSLDEPDAVFVGRRQQDLSCRVRTLIDPAEGCGGLAVRLDEEHHYEIEAAAEKVQVVARVGSLRTVVASRPAPAGSLVLGIEVTSALPRDSRTGPDTLAFGVEEADGTFAVLGALDGKYLSTEVAGGFTGRVVGMYAAAGTVHFDWFDYESLEG